MIVFVDERDTVMSIFATWLRREGVPASGLPPQDFAPWFDTLTADDAEALDGVLLGQFDDR
jgi:two-component system, OmpR family, flagellar system response regulator FtcR